MFEDGHSLCSLKAPAVDFEKGRHISCPASFIEMPVPSRESKQSRICVIEVSILPLSTIVLLGFGTVAAV